MVIVAAVWLMICAPGLVRWWRRRRRRRAEQARRYKLVCAHAWLATAPLVMEGIRVGEDAWKANLAVGLALGMGLILGGCLGVLGLALLGGGRAVEWWERLEEVRALISGARKTLSLEEAEDALRAAECRVCDLQEEVAGVQKGSGGVVENGGTGAMEVRS